MAGVLAALSAVVALDEAEALAAPAPRAPQPPAAPGGGPAATRQPGPRRRSSGAGSGDGEGDEDAPGPLAVVPYRAPSNTELGPHAGPGAVAAQALSLAGPVRSAFGGAARYHKAPRRDPPPGSSAPAAVDALMAGEGAPPSHA